MIRAATADQPDDILRSKDRKKESDKTILSRLLLVAITAICMTCVGQVVRTESTNVGSIENFYPGTSALRVTAKKSAARKYLQVDVVDAHGVIGLAFLTLADLSVIIANLEKLLEESSKSPDEFSYARPQSKFSASITRVPEPRVDFMVSGVLVAMLGKSERQNKETLQSLIDLMKKGRSILSIPVR